MGCIARFCRRAPLFFTVLLLPVAPASAEEGGVSPHCVKSWNISSFRIGSSETRFGALEFIGGLEMTSYQSLNSAAFPRFTFWIAAKNFSALPIPGSGMQAKWFAARKADLRQIDDFRMAPIQSEEGMPVEGKWNSDAEGMSVSGQTVTMSFERVHRIAEFALTSTTLLQGQKSCPCRCRRTNCATIAELKRSPMLQLPVRCKGLVLP